MKAFSASCSCIGPPGMHVSRLPLLGCAGEMQRLAFCCVYAGLAWKLISFEEDSTQREEAAFLMTYDGEP